MKDERLEVDKVAGYAGEDDEKNRVTEEFGHLVFIYLRQDGEESDRTEDDP